MMKVIKTANNKICYLATVRHDSNGDQRNKGDLKCLWHSPVF